MQQYHEFDSRKKVSKGTGGKRVKNRDKKLAHVGGVFAATKVSKEDVRKVSRSRGGNTKVKLKAAAFANIASKGKIQKAKIIAVVESSNPEYVRGNIITKGCVINTSLGKARVTNRIGQDGVVNGKLVS